jgi:ElaB/YqjD/DUF883 family membrane-anchored ribosome-binding protein
MRVQDVKERVQDWQQTAVEKARDVGEATDSYVRDNTWTAVACAALLGCVLGFLLSGRSDD